MPTKTTRTYTTPKRVVNIDGYAYLVTKTKLREIRNIVTSGYALKLADLVQNGRGTLVAIVPYTVNGNATYETSFYSTSTYEAEVTRGKNYITIGCQTFEGKNAATILKAARLAFKNKPLARAAAAGV